MNWLKIFFSGLFAWILPFIFNTFIFPDLPQGFKFILYLLSTCVVLIEYSNSRMSGYLHKRNKITVGIGLSIGITWFITSYLLAGIYFVGIEDETLFEYSVNTGSVFLMYPIIATAIGFSEERRGRRR